MILKEILRGNVGCIGFVESGMVKVRLECVEEGEGWCKHTNIILTAEEADDLARNLAQSAAAPNPAPAE